ncbi:hypothetical protein [Arabidopsis thaliana]|uniref:Uncharacterized protein AT4g38110 n=1 Tax=Arabidopsis thaliana TaxID=3702 RepID=Q9SZL1_ARATH|nr:hypothetical protein [Arabidopsis thaliana]CAB80476.1 hypothetical protein [Arabidopsis thaliana]
MVFAQVLRAVALNYPTLVPAYWERVSILVYKLLQSAVVEDSPTTWKSSVLDGCLRAISGFKGTEDLQYDRLMDTPFTSDCIRSIRISSAPSYGFDNTQEPIFQAGCDQWSEAIRKHIVLVLHHGSAVVRSTTVTCFAGITSSIFSAFNKQEKDFITSSIITAALHDKTPSVRSAACRAIGVRITASWALANLCDALRYRVDDRSFEGLKTTSQVVDALIECALRLTEDGDKIQGGWREPCKHFFPVQWNVCHALSNLFSNETVKLQDMDWAPSVFSILLLLLRDASNFKIRIQAASALAVPATPLGDFDSLSLSLSNHVAILIWRIEFVCLILYVFWDSYGRSFPDVVKGVEHTLQSLHSDRETTPANFKYKRSLENQVT